TRASFHAGHRSARPSVRDKSPLHPETLSYVSPGRLFFKPRPMVHFPVLNRLFVALAGSYDRFLQTETHLAHEIPAMIRMIAHPKFSFHGHSQPPAGPRISLEPIRGGSFCQDVGNAGLLLCGETCRRSWCWMRFEALISFLSPVFHPLADRPFGDSQRHCDVLLFPSGLFQFPGAFAPLFSPIGFLWCSHTSFYRLETSKL